jgi:hypothetical protein
VSGTETPAGAVPGRVIDVSKWQSSLPDLTGVIGVIARAGIGTAPDQMFVKHCADALSAGKWIGSYWFNYGPLTVVEQVDAYIERERLFPELSLHVIDWEGADGFTADQTRDFIRIYRAKTGRPIGLYASESRFRDLGQDWNWIANYSGEPRKSWDMWQYGPYHGVDGNFAKASILELVKGDPVDSFNSVATAMVVKVKMNAKVFPNSDLTGTPITLSAGRLFDYHGVFGNGARVITWENAPGDNTVYPIKDGWSGFVHRDFTDIPFAKPEAPDTTPFDQADIDAAKDAQKAEDQAALDAAAAQHEADQAALAACKDERDAALAQLLTATADERERIARALGQDAADRVRST